LASAAGPLRLTINITNKPCLANFARRVAAFGRTAMMSSLIGIVVRCRSKCTERDRSSNALTTNHLIRLTLPDSINLEQPSGQPKSVDVNEQWWMKCAQLIFPTIIWG